MLSPEVNEKLKGQVRHLLTTVGGAVGYANVDTVTMMVMLHWDTIMAVVMLMAGAGWSWFGKTEQPAKTEAPK